VVEREHDVGAQRPDLVDGRVVPLDRVGLHRAGRLVLVDEDDLLGRVEQPQVDVPLTQVGRERGVDAGPEPTVVEHLLGAEPGGHLVGVLTHGLRVVHPHRSLTDRLDLDQRIPVRVHAVLGSDTAVGVAVDVHRVVVQHDLDVGHSTLAHTAGRTPRWAHGVPAVAARVALPTPEQPTHAADAGLPLVVVGVPLVEDVLELEPVGLSSLQGALTGRLDAQVGRQRAPLALGDFAWMDDVLAPVRGVEGVLGLLQQVTLDVGDQLLAVLLRLSDPRERPGRLHAAWRARGLPSCSPCWHRVTSSPT
jgi:hypothetical protein